MRRRHRTSAEAGYSGIAAELGVYDDVFLCLSPGEPWLEHGIVEHRYKELRPTAYRQMIDRWGHVIQGPRRYSVTAFLTRTWARLAADVWVPRTPFGLSPELDPGLLGYPVHPASQSCQRLPCGVPKFGARCQKSAICRSDTNFGTPQGLRWPLSRLTPAAAPSLTDSPC